MEGEFALTASALLFALTICLVMFGLCFVSALVLLLLLLLLRQVHFVPNEQTNNASKWASNSEKVGKVFICKAN